MDPHFFDLINREIDGETSPEESDELRSIVATSPALKRQFDSLRNLVLEVESIPAFDPPPGLRDEILASIRTRQLQWQPPEDPRIRESEDLVGQLAAFRRSPMIRYALAIAAGFVFGFILYPLVGGLGQRPTLSTREVSGTMAPLVATASPGREHAATAITVDSIPATVSSRSTSTVVNVQVNLQGTTRSPLVVTWRPDRFALESLARQSGAPTVTVGATRAEISARAPAQLQLRLRRIQPADSPVHLETNAAGNAIAVTESR